MINKKLVFSILLSALFAGHTHATTYSFKTIDFPGSTSTKPASINASGQVTGNYSGGAFFYSSGTFTNIDIIGYYYCGSQNTCPYHVSTIPLSINDLGQVVGSRAWESHDPGPVSFLYSSTSGTSIKLTNTSYARDINNAGQVVGYGSPPIGSTLYYAGAYTYLSFTGDYNTFTFASGLNNKGQIVGTYYFWQDPAPQIRHGFVKNGGSYLTLDVPNAASTYGSSINSSGQVAGFNVDATGINHGYIYSGGAFKTFDVPGSIYSSSSNPGFPYPDPNLKINDKGQVSGTYTDVSGGFHGFVYSSGVVMTIDIPNATTTFVNDINASGQLTGYYVDNTGTHGFIATPILPPSSKKDCVKGGWKMFGFKSKEQCLRSIKRKHHRKHHETEDEEHTENQ
ncbi:MAG: hypothetical protein ABL933_05425 [Methyloglobulus sp.]|nr:hypothetical protein [Methyloglobulus sp.]